MQNRELTWLAFNERVLEESNFDGNPLLERLKFISIFSSNLDEFFMVRVGSLVGCMLFAPEYRDNKTGATAEQQLDAIYDQVASLYMLKDRCYSSVMEDLAKEDIHNVKPENLILSEIKFLEKHFVRNILPLLSPQIIDNRHPFPHISNKQLHIVAMLENKGKPLMGIIAVPGTLNRVFFPYEDGRFVLLEDIICYFSHLAFSPYKPQERTIMAVTRNADINTEEDALDEDIDYRQFMKKLIKKRHRLAAVRLELQSSMSKSFISLLCNKLDLHEKQVFISAAPLDLSYVFAMEEQLGTQVKRGLTRPPHSPVELLPDGKRVNLVKLVSENDILLSYPFENMSLLVELLRQAAEDPAVLSIKITLYRIDFQSRIAESLIRAAENGKEVIVLMELRARFDEANNIEWSQRLDEAGCRVIFGPTGYKVHSKVCLITRKEFGRIHHITQVGTGNYNEKTARQYTDLSLITANQEIGRDAAAYFNSLLLGRVDEIYAHLWVSPNSFKSNFLDCIDIELEKAKRGEKAQITIKCNSITDKEIIEKLIEASQSGVMIALIVRGICCLKPQVPGYTDNITVISIVGRFLEHSRVYCFGADENQRMYISSADLMTRNTERRVEIACPVLDSDIRQRIFNMLETMLRDNTKAWEQFADGRYLRRNPPPDLVINSQELFIAQAREAVSDALSRDKGKTSLRPRFQEIFEKLKAVFVRREF